MKSTFSAKLRPDSAFLRNVLTLGTGTTLAQLVPVLASPLLTRLYTPTDFGVLAFFLSVTAMVGVIANGNYEFAILLPDDDGAAFSLLVLCFILLSLTTILFLVLTVIVGQRSIHIFGMSDATILYVAPLGVLLINLFRVLNLWFNRLERYKLMSLSRIGRTVGIALFSILLGLTGFKLGLLWGVIAGYGVSSLFLLVVLYRKDRLRFRNISLQHIGRVARENANFPKYTILTSLMEAAALQAPLLVFPALFGPLAAGWLALSQRVTRTPLGLIARAVGDVFRQRASRLFLEDGGCRALFTNTLKILVLISLVPFVLLLAWAPWVFATVFGEEWRMAGHYTRILAVSFWLQFLTNPVSSVLHIAGRQRLGMVIQMINTFGVVAALTAGYLAGGVLTTLYLLVVAGCLKYILQLYAAYIYSENSRPTIA